MYLQLPGVESFAQYVEREKMGEVYFAVLKSLTPFQSLNPFGFGMSLPSFNRDEKTKIYFALEFSARVDEMVVWTIEELGFATEETELSAFKDRADSLIESVRGKCKNLTNGRLSQSPVFTPAHLFETDAWRLPKIDKPETPLWEVTGAMPVQPAQGDGPEQQGKFPIFSETTKDT
jgi:hypothetical protein